MFTYGYIREATMAHLDMDESEAQAMSLLSRFHIFANEAIQAICSNKPQYKYVIAKVVDEFAPLIRTVDGIRPATDAEIEANVNIVNEEQTLEYYHERDTYEVGEVVKFNGNFIAFADKASFKKVAVPITTEKLFSDTKYIPTYTYDYADNRCDFMYIDKEQLMFYKSGDYFIPAKYMWFVFSSDLSDESTIDMPSDILLTIPLYIASICLQIDNPQKASIKRNEFELALSRCTSTNFMPLNKIKSSW